MTVPEFQEWLAFQQIDPSSEWRADYRHAMICAMVQGMFTKRSVTPQQILDDWMAFEAPRIEEKDPKKLEDEMLSYFRGFKNKMKD